MRSGLALSALSAVVAAAGCGEVGASRGEGLPRWPLELQVRIGSLDDPELGLTSVSRVAFGPDCLVYIAQSSEREVRAYGIDGAIHHRIGRDGEGPGEFRSISAIGFMHDTLFVSDGALTYLVLLALARGEAHGWAIIKRIDEITAGGTKPSSGSLYLAMVRLEERGLLEEVEPPRDETDERRRYYRLTAFGKRVLEAETRRLAGLVKEAARQGVVQGRNAASRAVPRKA